MHPQLTGRSGEQPCCSKSLSGGHSNKSDITGQSSLIFACCNQNEELFDNNNIQSDYRNIYKKEEHYFQSDIDKQIKERFVYPTKQIYQLIEFLESRRLRSVENLVVLISAILGGAIGAILIILLSN